MHMGQMSAKYKVSHGAVEGQSRVQPCAISSIFFISISYICSQVGIVCNYIVDGRGGGSP